MLCPYTHLKITYFCNILQYFASFEIFCYFLGKSFQSWWESRDGVRVGFGPEKSGFPMKIEVQTFKNKIQTQTGL